MFTSQIKFDLNDHGSNEQHEVFALEAQCSQCKKLALILKFLKTSAFFLSFVSMSTLAGVAQVFQKSDILLSYPQTKNVRDKYSATGIAWVFCQYRPIGTLKIEITSTSLPRT